LLPENALDEIAPVIRIEAIPSEDWANLKKYNKANAAVKASSKETKVIFMGNSITEGWVRQDLDFFKTNAFVGRGISGQTSAQILLRFRSDVIDLNPQVVAISAVTNDIAANRGPVTLEYAMGNIKSMAQVTKANGIEIVLASVLPASSFGWRPAIYPGDSIIELNKMIKAFAEENDIS